jgi:hypothetical protein
LIRKENKCIETPFGGWVKLLELRYILAHISVTIRFPGTPDQVIEPLGLGFGIVYLQRRQIRKRVGHMICLEIGYSKPNASQIPLRPRQLRNSRCEFQSGGRGISRIK